MAKKQDLNMSCLANKHVAQSSLETSSGKPRYFIPWNKDSDEILCNIRKQDNKEREENLMSIDNFTKNQVLWKHFAGFFVSQRLKQTFWRIQWLYKNGNKMIKNTEDTNMRKTYLTTLEILVNLTFLKERSKQKFLWQLASLKILRLWILQKIWKIWYN